MQVFVPKVAPPGAQTPALWKSPWFRAGSILVTQVLGWPLYLMFNIGGRFYDRWVPKNAAHSPTDLLWPTTLFLRMQMYVF